MATSSALSTSNKYIKYQITVNEGAANIEENYSYVEVGVDFYRTNTGYTTYGTGTVYCRINGTLYSESVSLDQKITNSGVLLFAKGLNIPHNDDGTKTLSVTAWIDHSQVTSSEQGFSVELATIARASQPSCITWPDHTQDVGEFGDTISIYMNRKADSFTHTVRYVYGNLTGTIATNVTTSTTWEIPLSFMNQIPNATSGSGTIYVDTYSGSQLIGIKSCVFTASVPDSIKPSCSIQVLDTTDIKDTYGSLVQGLSTLYIKTTAVQAYSSPIIRYDTKVTLSDSEGTTQTDYTSNGELNDIPLPTSGTVTISSTVTDERGRKSTAATVSFPVLAYVKPAVSALAVHRCDADGVEYDQGEYVNVTFSAAITPLNDINGAAYKICYKKSSDTSYTEIVLADLAGNYTITDYSYIFAADSDYSYDVEIAATDDINTTTRSTSASTGYTFMDWNDDGKSLAFGKVSEKSGLEVDWVSYFYKDMYDKAGAKIGNGLAEYESENIDPNITIEHLILTAHGNAPNGYGVPYYIQTLFDGNKSITANRMQIAFPYNTNGSTFYRCYSGSWSTWIRLASTNDLPERVILYDNLNGSSGTITFSEGLARFSYVEIFYCDNNTIRGGYTKIYPPYDALLTLQLQEAGNDTYLRQSLYTVTNTQLIPDPGQSGYAIVNINNSCTVSMGTNYIKITRVVGIT